MDKTTVDQAARVLGRRIILVVEQIAAKENAVAHPADAEHEAETLKRLADEFNALTQAARFLSS